MAITNIRTEWVRMQFGRRDHLNARVPVAAYQDSLVAETLGVVILAAADHELDSVAAADVYDEEKADYADDTVVVYTDGVLYRSTMDNPAADALATEDQTGWELVNTPKVDAPVGANAARISYTGAVGDILNVSVNNDRPGTSLPAVTAAATFTEPFMVMVPTIPEHPYPTEDKPEQGYIRFGITQV